MLPGLAVSDRDCPSCELGYGGLPCVRLSLDVGGSLEQLICEPGCDGPLVSLVVLELWGSNSLCVWARWGWGLEQTGKRICLLRAKGPPSSVLREWGGVPVRPGIGAVEGRFHL